LLAQIGNPQSFFGHLTLRLRVCGNYFAKR
jgi:hypothetical protein